MSSQVLIKLAEKATVAENILVKVKAQLEAVKQTAMLNFMNEEKSRLEGENQRLRNEIDGFKKELILAEIGNGVKQVYIPTERAIKQAVSSSGEKKCPDIKKEVEKKSNNKIDSKEKVDKAGPKKGSTPTKGAPLDGDLKAVDVSSLDLRVGLIVSAKKHPDADKQYVEEVDVGDEGGRTRSVVSGLVDHMPVEAIHNRLGIFLCNLKPAKIRGVLSEAMLICACTPDKVELLDPPSGCAPGDRVTCTQFPGKPETLLNPKKKIWETVKPDLKTNNKCIATFKDQVLLVEGKGNVTAKTLADAQLS